MPYSNEEIIAHVNAQLRQTEEIRRQTKETIEIKRRLWIEGETRRIIDEQGASITDEEFQQIVENTLQFLNEQQGQRTIVINEINLGG